MNNKFTIDYNLPQHWEETKDISFNRLSDLVLQIHEATQSAAIKAVNRFATVRNYIIGYYIVEYEQHGSDRAKYGDRLLKRLAEKINKRGINETLLKISRRFYLDYPQIRNYLLGSKDPTLLSFSGKSATASHLFETPSEIIISQLSFSHIREILTVDDPIARYFYEKECIRCCGLEPVERLRFILQRE
jgi:hypothetical protein